MNEHTSRLRIGHKFSLITSILVVLTMCVFWLVTSYNTETILRQQADSLGQSLARQTAILVTELVLSNDLISMNVLLNQLTRDGAISQAAVLSVDDQVIAIAGRSVSAGGAQQNQVFRSYISPIALQDSLAGYVRINLDESYIEAGVSRNFNFMLIAMALLVLVAVTVTMALAQHFIGLPLRALAARIQRLQHGTIELSPWAEREDEVGAVAREYNLLAHALVRGPQGRPALPGQYDALLESEDDEQHAEGSAVVTASVLQLQIGNHPALLRGPGAQDMLSRLNTSYFLAAQVAELYNGKVEYFAQDSISISFGARQLDEEHAFHACCSALLFLSLMQRLNQAFKDAPALEFQAGLHCGDVLTGVLSPLGRRRYTIAGESLEMARRICNEGAPGVLVISEQTLAVMDEDFTTEPYSEFFDDDLDQLVCTWMVTEAAAGLGALLESQAEHLLSLEVPA